MAAVQHCNLSPARPEDEPLPPGKLSEQLELRHGQDPPSNGNVLRANRGPTLASLPIELRRAILTQMDLATLRHMRMTSKFWARLGEEYLIDSRFTTLPHRADFARLNHLAVNSRYPQFVKHLDINLGEINEYHARHNFYFLQYARAPEEQSPSRGESWWGYYELKNLTERYSSSCCAPELIGPAFAKLRGLESISVSLTTCPFDEDLLRSIWRIPTTRLLPRVATCERFTNLLEAIAQNGTSVKRLSHDRLPFEFFAQKESIMRVLRVAFSSVTSLSLMIDYSELPNNLHAAQASQNLCSYLQAAPALEVLEFGFHGRTKVDISELLECLKESDQMFSQLKGLRIEGVACKAQDLGDFLVRNRKLRHLQLGGLGVVGPHDPPNGGIQLTEGSFGWLFRRVRDAMKLEKFQVQGDLIGLESRERFILEVVEEAADLHHSSHI